MKLIPWEVFVGAKPPTRGQSQTGRGLTRKEEILFCEGLREVEVGQRARSDGQYPVTTESEHFSEKCLVKIVDAPYQVRNHTAIIRRHPAPLFGWGLRFDLSPDLRSNLETKKRCWMKI